MKKPNRNRYLATAILATMLIFNIVIGMKVISSSSSESSSTTICIDPPRIAKTLGANFTVNINIENVTDLYAWQAWLKWDPELLDVVDVTEGDFLETGKSIPWAVVMNQTEGWISVSDVDFTHLYTGMNSSGTLAKVTFHSIGTGECVLDLYDIKLFSSNPVSVTTPPYLGDESGDLIVNALDLNHVGKAYGSFLGHPRYNPNADFNNDGFIDLFDILCVAFNFGRTYPGNAGQPVEIAHEVQDGYVVTVLPFSTAVTWKWLDYDENQVWLTVNVTISNDNPIENFNFNRSLGHINFNFTSDVSGFCNATVPKLLMDGAFKVLINGTETASILAWNKTHTFIYFTYDQGTYNVTILGELVTRIRSIDLLTLSDINGDGVVDILDIYAVAARFNWKEDG